MRCGLVAYFIIVFLTVASIASQAYADAAQSSVLAAFACTAAIPLIDAEKTIQKVQQKYSQLRSLSADFFQYSYLAAVDQGEESGGHVKYLSKGNMRWDYDRPEAQTFVVRDQTVWLLQPRLNQVVIDSLNQVVISQLPTAFLMGLGDLAKDFKIVDGCKTSAGVKVKLLPNVAEKASKGEGRGLESFELLLAEQTALPQGADIIDLGGNRTAFLFRKLIADDNSVGPAAFTVGIPEGVDVDDRRASGAAGQ